MDVKNSGFEEMNTSFGRAVAFGQYYSRQNPK